MALYQHKFSGICATGEDWSFSWWSNSTGDLATLQGQAVTWITNFWNGPAGANGYKTMVTAGVVCNMVRTSLITLATGLQTQLAETPVTLPGIATGNALPADVAVVVSLRTTLANRSGRGRFYLPQPAATVCTTLGKLGTTAQGFLADNLANAWTAYSSFGDPVVYSRTGRSTQSITSFNVGDQFDTQRRRENKVAQVRTVRTMP